MKNLEGKGRRATGKREKSGRGERKRERERETERGRESAMEPPEVAGRHRPPFFIVLFVCCVPCSGKVPWC